MLRRAAALFLTVILTTAAAGCAPQEPTGYLSVETGSNMSAVELIDTLESTPVDDRQASITASVLADRVLFTNGVVEEEYPLPDDLFYLSVAPYVSQTHDCFFHSPTTCLGELRSGEFDVTVVTDTGEILVDEPRTAADNGFIGLWLPSGLTATLTITGVQGTASATIGTGPEDPTCITTLRLS